MTYRQSEMYNCAKYLKNLPLQSVSSRGNLLVVLPPVYIYIYILILYIFIDLPFSPYKLDLNNT